MSGLRTNTTDILSRLNLKDRKRLGQYFTPNTIRKVLLDALPDGFVRIMEPSFGTGEFISDLVDRYSEAKIDGYEIDAVLHGSVDSWLDHPGCLTHGDFLSNQIEAGTYDLVIGNPPYFQTKPDSRFAEVTSGRPNIFAYFFQEATRVLKPGGYLAFVVPAGMCTSAYFSNLRKFLITNYGIRMIKRFDDKEFVGATQSVVGFVGQKSGENLTRLVTANGMFNMYDDDLLHTKGKTLKELGFLVKTGNVVWNQWKDCLTDDRGPILFWSTNINDVGICPQKKRPPFLTGRVLEKIKPFMGPALLVRRTLGTVGKGQICVGILPYGQFYAENHVNVIFDKDGDRLKWLMGELKKPITNELARRITGNTQLSKSELQNLLPIGVNDN